MRRFIYAGAALAAALIVSAAMAADEKANEKCPVSRRPVNKEIFLEINGHKLYFCCKNCPKRFEQRIGVKDEGPGKCPISGRPAKAATRMIHSTTEMVYFCCPNCRKNYAKKKGFEFKEGEPGKCPVSGRPAKKEASVGVNGRTIYFCCNNCKKKFVSRHHPKDSGPKACPVSGRPAKKDVSMMVTQAKAVYFCCNNCKKKYIAKNFGE